MDELARGDHADALRLACERAGVPLGTAERTVLPIADGQTAAYLTGRTVWPAADGIEAAAAGFLALLAGTTSPAPPGG